jgi:hypothetical protein
VIVVADRPAAWYRPGQPLALDVHVVSDQRTPMPGAEVHATLAWPGGEQQWRWAGDIPADSCERVGTLQAVVPDAPGALTLDLALSAGEMAAINHYVSRITRS